MLRSNGAEFKGVKNNLGEGKFQNFIDVQQFWIFNKINNIYT